jgi:hypothetical protein
MFTVFNKSGGIAIVTNGTGTQWLTIPGVGTNLQCPLGTWGSTSNEVTFTFDGTNY